MWVCKLCVRLAPEKTDCSNQESRLDHTAGVRFWRIGLNLHTHAHRCTQTHKYNVPMSFSRGAAQGATVWTAVVSSTFMMWMPVFINLLPCSSYLWLMLNIRMCCWSIYQDKSGLNSFCRPNTLNTTSTTLHSTYLLIANLLIRRQMALSDHSNLSRNPGILLGSHVLHLNYDRRNLFPVFVPGWHFVAPPKKVPAP